jgi:alkylhydroperoxidase family enzyme
VASEDLRLAQKAEAGDAKTAAALKFAVEVVRERGMVSLSAVDTLRKAGYGDGEITEIVAVVAINIFTNYFNHIAGTEIDFPMVQAAC